MCKAFKHAASGTADAHADVFSVCCNAARGKITLMLVDASYLAIMLQDQVFG